VIRHAFRMSVHPGQQGEYARRHQPIWKELEATLLRHGVRTYSIFLDESTNDLFAYVEFEEQAQWAAIAATDVCRRWWRFMEPLMPSNADASPVTTPLTELFHLERRWRRASRHRRTERPGSDR
jgi:L-rhamnose mutarotase